MAAPGQMKAKVCMVGDAAVGKTSLVRRFVFDTFSDQYQTTLGAKVVGKDVLVREETGEVPVKLTIWDIIGETSLLPELAESYFLNAQAIVAVCDLTRYSTFERLPIWLQAVERVTGDVPKALAVNKTDLRTEVLTLYDEHRVGQFADEVGARWFSTSAKTGEGVEAMFAALAQDIVEIGREQQARARFVDSLKSDGP
ncbi:MAG TPA: Rab family GTPase [Thermoplasmata archaeon]|nr:Rab family GTPase [Thermoplasmata archaeon]